MSVDTGGEPGRYWAFISYSHKDAAFGHRLHRRLEGYVLPRRLVGRGGGMALPRRLAPIFRDREEFSAAQDLSAEVRAALAQSRSLVVVCSPAAAASAWVTREVELFRGLHPDRPILAAIRAGEPADSLPPALRRTNAAGETIEPLAADFRAGHDGWEHGLLKLVAGIVGVGLDELVQRDSQRRLRRVTTVTAGALSLVLVMAVLTVFALNARSEAERQRSEAEGLVEFMLTDLRATLKGVGRLDAMTAVNARALKYYGDQDLSRLPPDSLERRARILHAIGEDDETQGKLDRALSEFREASRTTEALLELSPSDPERIFNHAQSEYWIGSYEYARGRYAAALPHFQAYKALADRMVTLAPENPRYLRELGYAEGNLCALALNPPKKPASALTLCSAALRHMEAAARRMPTAGALSSDLSNRHSWMASAYLEVGDRANAKRHLLAQEKILSGLMAADPKDMRWKSSWIVLQRILAWIENKEGRSQAAILRLQSAMQISDRMIAFEPNNKTWAQQRASLISDEAKFSTRQ